MNYRSLIQRLVVIGMGVISLGSVASAQTPGLDKISCSISYTNSNVMTSTGASAGKVRADTPCAIGIEFAKASNPEHKVNKVVSCTIPAGQFGCSVSPSDIPFDNCPTCGDDLYPVRAYTSLDVLPSDADLGCVSYKGQGPIIRLRPVPSSGYYHEGGAIYLQYHDRFPSIDWDYYCSFDQVYCPPLPKQHSLFVSQVFDCANVQPAPTPTPTALDLQKQAECESVGGWCPTNLCKFQCRCGNFEGFRTFVPGYYDCIDGEVLACTSRADRTPRCSPDGTVSGQ